MTALKQANARSRATRWGGLAAVSIGAWLFAVAPSQAVPVLPPPAQAPVLTEADCDPGSTLVSLQRRAGSGVIDPNGLFLLGTWTTTPHPTDAVLPAGALEITNYWSWHRGPLGGVVEINQQWSVQVGGVTSAFTEDLATSQTSSLTVGSLGLFNSPGGGVSIPHASTPGAGYPGVLDGTMNSVAPLGFCYKAVVSPSTTTTAEPTTTTAAPTTTTAAPATTTTTAAPTSTSTSVVVTTTNPVSPTVSPTVAPSVVPPAVTTAPPPASTPAASSAAPTSVASSTTFVASAGAAATSSAPRTSAGVQVLGAEVTTPSPAGDDVAFTGAASRSTAGIAAALLCLGLVLLAVGRRRTN